MVTIVTDYDKTILKWSDQMNALKLMFTLGILLFNLSVYSQTVNSQNFLSVGHQKDGIECPPKVFYPECKRTAKEDAIVQAKRKCYPEFAKQISPWKTINQLTVSAQFECSEFPDEPNGSGELKKVCEIDSTPGNSCNRTHGVCMKCRYVRIP